MTITDLINNDTIVPVTQEERFSVLPPAWMIYEVLKWGDWYISPVGSNGEGARKGMVQFVVIGPMALLDLATIETILNSYPL